MPTGLHQHIPSVLWSQAAVATLLDSALPPKGHGDHSEGLQLRLPEAKQVLEATAQRTQRMDGMGRAGVRAMHRAGWPCLVFTERE